MNSRKHTPLFILLFLALNCWSQTNIPPTITAVGDQIYCPLTPINIALDFNIVDPDNTAIDAVFIQISTGYIQGEDRLDYIGSNPNISSSWNNTQGKLTLKLPLAVTDYTDLIAAVKEVVFTSNSNTVSGEKFFSFTIDAANFLPSTGHYYEFVQDLGINWTDAKIAAESRNLYGLQGYLTTITSIEEAQLTGEQASGAGWIGGSDADNEGVWKWVTGPENGLIFWNGLANGSSPPGVFSFWNTNEPNQSGDEDYAHITAPNVGIIGSWNDLKHDGDPPGNFHPKGYMVEYGGMPGNPILNIFASTKITVGDAPQFNLTENLFVCLNDLPLTVSITNPDADYDYVWHNENGAVIGNNSPSVAIVEGGVYSVTATTTDGTLCSKTKSITITESVTATIEQLDVTDDSNNNTISLVVSGTGDYEIALDNLADFGPFESFEGLPNSHRFSNVIAGIHQVFIRDKNGCGLTIKEAVIIGFPRFLTPNGDGINDTWNVAGAALQPNSLIFIFDRFGKLIAKIDPTGRGWDGTFNGRQLPSTDYWFTARLQDGRLRKGHFSLVRR